MIYRSTRIDLYQDRKIVQQYLIIHSNDDQQLVFKGNSGQWFPIGGWLQDNVNKAYENNWQYGRKDEGGEIFHGYTKVKHNKRWLTPKIYDGATDVETFTTQFVDDCGATVMSHRVNKEDYVPHIQRTIIKHEITGLYS